MVGFRFWVVDKVKLSLVWFDKKASLGIAPLLGCKKKCDACFTTTPTTSLRSKTKKVGKFRSSNACIVVGSK